MKEQEKLVPCVMALKYMKYPPSLTKYMKDLYTDTYDMLLRTCMKIQIKGEIPYSQIGRFWTVNIVIVPPNYSRDST